MTDLLRTVLVANRGEIAVRIVRACRDAGLRSAAVFAADDEAAPHVRLADYAVRLDGDGVASTYLNGDALLAAACSAGADAVHPGYGFLSEDAAFAEAVLNSGLTWIGPPPSAIRALGDKTQARALALSVGAPVTPGTDGPVSSASEVLAFGETHGYPLAIKAAHGGGGRGLRVVRAPEEVEEALGSATRESLAAFGVGACFAERFVEGGRHIEVQVLADMYGGVQVLGTRDCTLQRRNQKLVEEAPAPFLSADQERRLVEASVALCGAAGYVGAGTVEFLLGRDGQPYFLEVNARLQVEHTVTEEVCDVDLVREQLRIAMGDRVVPGVRQPRRHAIQFRINAEDPTRGFLPAGGTLTRFAPPAGPGVRVDSGVVEGMTVGSSYDSLLAKLIVVGPDRRTALERSRRALGEFDVMGVATVLPFHRHVVEHPAFSSDDALVVHTRWIDETFDAAVLPRSASAGFTVTVGGRELDVELPGLSGASSPELAEVRRRATAARAAPATLTTDTVEAPMQGTVVRVAVEEGQRVDVGDLVGVVEAMKMENPLHAPQPGFVTGLRVAVGDIVIAGQVLCRVLSEVEGVQVGAAEGPPVESHAG